MAKKITAQEACLFCDSSPCACGKPTTVADLPIATEEPVLATRGTPPPPPAGPPPTPAPAAPSDPRPARPASPPLPPSPAVSVDVAGDNVARLLAAFPGAQEVTV